MPVAIVTGSGGLIGSEAVRHFAGLGFDVVGIENDLRSSFFGPEASTRHNSEALESDLDGFTWVDMDIRDADGIDALFLKHAGDRKSVV